MKPIKFIELDSESDSYIFQYRDRIEVQREMIPSMLKIYLWMGTVAWVFSFIMFIAEQKIGYLLFACLFPIAFVSSLVQQVLVIDFTAHTMQVQHRLGDRIIKRGKVYDYRYAKSTVQLTTVTEGKYTFPVHRLKIEDKKLFDFYSEYDYNDFLKMLGDKVTITDMEIDVSKRK